MNRKHDDDDDGRLWRTGSHHPTTHPSENALGWEERQRARLPTRDYMDTTNRIMREKNKLIGELEDIISNYQQQIELMRIELLIRPRLPKPRDDVV